MAVGDFPIDSSKIAVVTGGGSGIGLCFVKRVLDAGAKVLIVDLKLTPEAEQLVSASNGHAVFMQCDVSSWPQLEAIPSEITKAFGEGAVAQVWVAGAAVFEPQWSSFFYDTEKEHYKALQINVEHPIKLTRIAMRSCLGADKPGVMLIIASMAGITGQYAAALYCASKHALVGFTKSMGQADIDENFKVVCVCPGMVATPLWTGEQAKAVAAQFSFTDDVCISPDEVAKAMMEMIEQGQYEGGSLLEVAKGRLRERLESRQGIDVTAPGMKEWADKNFAPMREIFRKERGVAKSNNSL